MGWLWVGVPCSFPSIIQDIKRILHQRLTSELSLYLVQRLHFELGLSILLQWASEGHKTKKLIINFNIMKIVWQGPHQCPLPRVPPDPGWLDHLLHHLAHGDHLEVDSPGDANCLSGCSTKLTYIKHVPNLPLTRDRRIVRKAAGCT